MIGIRMESTIWERMANGKVTFHVIHDEHVAELDRLLRPMIRDAQALGKQDLLQQLWNLRLAVHQTLLTFDAAPLGLEAIATSIANAPELRNHRTGLVTAMELLVGKTSNPKKEVIDSIYCGLGPHEAITIWNCRLPERAFPGWPEGTIKLLENEYGTGQFEVIGGRRSLPAIGSQLVLPSPLHRSTPAEIHALLLRPGRWESVHILRYSTNIENHEFTRSALEDPPVQPWLGKWTMDVLDHGQPATPLTPAIDDEPPLPDDILFFQDIFGREEPSHEEPVDACLVRLSSSFYVAFPSDAMVRLLNGSKEWVSTSDLEEGDLIPVRTDNPDRQRHSLEAAAEDRLGGRNHAGSIKARLREWKQVVRTCLNRHGETRFRQLFDRFSGGESEAWRSDAWSSEDVWAPRSRKGFRALILATHELGFFLNEPDIEAFTRSNWSDVQQLRNAHRQAGRDQISQLDGQLEEQMTQRDEWKEGDEVSLVDGGRKYQVFEVLSVSNIGKRDPNQLERLRKWQG